MIFGAFGRGYHRFLSETAVAELMDRAPTSALHRDVLARHLKRGLFSYAIEGHQKSKYLGVIKFHHHALLQALLSTDVPLTTLRGILDHHLAALCNTVLHQPFEDYLGLLSPDADPLSVSDLRPHTRHLSDWMAHVRNTYLAHPFPAYARKTAYSVALDMMRLIQAIHENTLLVDEGDPFAQAGATDRQAILETLNNALLTLNQQGVLRYPLPRYPNLENLLMRPDLAVACSPDGPVIPIAGVDVFEGIAMETGRPIPARAAISPDPDTLLDALTDRSMGLSWGVYTSSTETVQSVVVQSPCDADRYTVFAVRLDCEMYCYSGELVRGDLGDMADRLVFMVNRSGVRLADEVAALHDSPMGAVQ